MPDPSPIFDHHYQAYLKRLAGLDFGRIGPAAGAEIREGHQGPVLSLGYFNTAYQVSAQGIIGPEGKPVPYDTCAILSRYLIMADDRPVSSPQATPGDWTSFRDLREAGPLTVYFRDNVEAVICRALAGHCDGAARRLSPLGAVPADIGARYDLMLEFPGLPHIPMLLLFNDEEDGFPASCSVLFRSDVEDHLDAECIAMMGYRLAALIRSCLKSDGGGEGGRHNGRRAAPVSFLSRQAS